MIKSTAAYQLCLRALCLWAALAAPNAWALFDDECPDFKTPACVDLIKKHINGVDMQRARDAAETQCFESPEQDEENPLTEKSMLLNASGCFYLHSLESLLGHDARAFEARTRALQIARFGCENGQSRLCELLIGFLASGIADLIDDFLRDLAASDQAGLLNGAQIRRIELARAFPRSVEEQVMRMVTDSSQKHLSRPLKRCDSCEVVSQNHPRKNLTAPLPQKVVDLSVSHDGSNTRLNVKIFNQKNKLEFQRNYSTEIIAKRYALFGYNAITSRDMLRARKLEEYQPITKITFGTGLQRMKNIAGGPDDQMRVVAELRSVERFNKRRSEFGLLGQYQMTASLFKKALGSEDVPEDPKDENLALVESETVNSSNSEPYRSAVGLWGIYSHMFMAVGTGYDSIRNGAHIGLGLFVTPLFQTYSARIGWDIHVARSWVMGISALYVGPAEMALEGGKIGKVPDVGGGQFVLSYNF